jgi:hypothetical protein
MGIGAFTQGANTVLLGKAGIINANQNVSFPLVKGQVC